MNITEIAELEKDIIEIKNLLNKETFNRSEAISLIEKHKIKDLNIALVNSPLMPNFVPYQCATEDMLKRNLYSLMEYLSIKLLKSSE